MTIELYCQHCGQRMEIADQYAGESGTCKYCGKEVLVPEGGVDADSASPPTQNTKDIPYKWIGVTAAVVAVIAIGIYTFFVAPASESGFKPVFNGRDLSGWEGDTAGYAVQNGELVCTSSTGHLYTVEIFDDFVLKFDFKLTPGANSGLSIRVPPDAGNAAYDAIELQILDNTAPMYRALKPSQYHGSVYGVIPAKRGHLKPVGEWNEQEVIANGHHITVILNGIVILDADLKEASQNGTMDQRPHPGLLRPSGRIGFLGHGDRVYFRNIRVNAIE